MASCSKSCSTIILTLVGFIFWGAAAALIFLGAWVFKTYKHYEELTTANITLVPAAIVIVVGIFLFILGCVGCVAACKENKCLLAIFFSLLLVVLTAEIMAGVLGYVFRKNIRTAVEDGLDKAVNKYDNSSVSTDQIDYMQSQLKCCGINNASDWSHATAWMKNHTGRVPTSCCDKSVDKACSTPLITDKAVYKQGCLSKLENQFQKNLYYVAGVAIAFAVIQLLGMICSCILMCRSQEVRYEILGGPNSGLRV